MDETSSRLNIESLTLTNFRCFRDFTVAFNLEKRDVFSAEEKPPVGPLTVLVARNGRGKTSVLDALRILFGTYANAFSQRSQDAGQVKSSVHATHSDIRLFRDGNDALAQCDELAINATMQLGAETATVGRKLLKRPGSRTTTREIAPITDFAGALAARRARGEDVVWPLVAFYGTGRLWNATKNTKRTLLAMSSPAFGYENCLGESHDFKAVAAWLTKAVSKRNIDAADDLKRDRVMEAQIQAVTRCLEPILEHEGYLPELTIESLTDELAIKQQTPDGAIPMAISQLSDGVRAVFGLVADIAFRCAKLNPFRGADAPLMTNGVVLIDEVDLHLHPAWQQRILNMLQRAFPQLQFIVTTHSPQVVSSVPKECVRVVNPDAESASSLSSQTQGVESQDVLANVFGTNPAPERDQWVMKLEEYADQVAQGKALGDSPLYAELRGHYGADYQPLLRIELQRRFQRREGTPNA